MSSLNVLTSALEFAARKHCKQRRKGADGIPYINHPIEVVNLLAHTMRTNDVELLTAAVLHDTLEDTETTQEEIVQQFGVEVFKLVLEVTDNMSLPKAKRKQLQLEHAKDLSIKAKQIKIADKTCNILDMLTTRMEWTHNMKIKYVIWAEGVIAACRGVNTELEAEFDKAVSLAREILGDF